MLDRAQLAQQLAQISDSLFEDTSQESELLLREWQKICADSTFIYRIKSAATPWPLPSWSGSLNEVHTIDAINNTYSVLSVDGSQIYPDRHFGVFCYLINIGGVLLRYGHAKPVTFFSTPYVFTGKEETEEVDLSTEYVNGKRQEFEFSVGLTHALSMRPESTEPFVLLFDGSLIFWHLEAKDLRLRDLFLNRYLSVMHQLYEEKVLFASYISYPKSKELVNLVRLSLCNFNSEDKEAYVSIAKCIDSTIVSSYLGIQQRTGLFQNNSSISNYYPHHLRPYFFYINIGDEIARVEIPAYIAQNEDSINQIAQVVFDQNKKGYGYPVALSEAHEQAVVKGPDRDFFYHLLSKMSMERKRRFSYSQKSLKKRSMGI